MLPQRYSSMSLWRGGGTKVGRKRSMSVALDILWYVLKKTISEMSIVGVLMLVHIPQLVLNELADAIGHDGKDEAQDTKGVIQLHSSI
jgi:hypothetical protein